MRLVAKSLIAGVIIQVLLLLLMFVTGAVLPEDDAITDGLHFVTLSFMPSLFFFVLQSDDGPTPVVLILCSAIDVIVYSFMIVSFLWWRQRQSQADDAERRALRIT
jgi:hypothetical protein